MADVRTEEKRPEPKRVRLAFSDMLRLIGAVWLGDSIASHSLRLAVMALACYAVLVVADIASVVRGRRARGG
jgi:hypothetical protein